MRIEIVRAYLLGTLGEEEAASLEEKYFLDRKFFLSMESIESELIRDYLAGRLPAQTRQQFESRYLKVPELRRRLEAMRAEVLKPAVPRISRPTFSIALAFASAALIVVSGVIWLRTQRSTPDSPSPADQQILATITLSPGVQMGGSNGARLQLPAGRGLVELMLELPQTGSGNAYSTRVSRVEANGFVPVWTAPNPLAPDSEARLHALVDSDVLTTGDYVVEVSGIGKPLRATYVLRTLAAP